MSSIALAPNPPRTAARPVAQPVTRPVARPVRPARHGGGLRLTRRGRLTVFLTFLVATLAVSFFALSSAASGSGERGRPEPVRMVQVESGDTLWSIATRTAPEQDPRDVVHDIQELNSLDGTLRVGTAIAVPVAD